MTRRKTLYQNRSLLGSAPGYVRLEPLAALLHKLELLLVKVHHLLGDCSLMANACNFTPSEHGDALVTRMLAEEDGVN